MAMSPAAERETQRAYEPPRIDTYSGAEILKLLGPAVAVYGGLPGGP